MHSSNFQNLAITTDQASAYAQEYYGLAATAKKLDGEVDFNFYLKTDDGEEYTLKISRPDTKESTLDFQASMMQYLKEQDLPFDIPELIPGLNDKPYQKIKVGQHKGRWIRLQKWVQGRMLDDVHPRSKDILLQWGRLAGLLSAKLEGYDHEAGHRFYKWNPSETLESKKHLPYFATEEEKEIAEYFWGIFEHQTLPKLASLRQGINYNDAHEHNLLVNNDTANPRIQGIIDFGDAIYTHKINELAIACAYACMYFPDPLEAASHLIKGYNDEFQIEEKELEVLYSMISARLMITVASAAWNKHVEPENEYLLVSEKPAWDLLKKWRHINPQKAYFAFRAACGLTPCPIEQACRTRIKESESNTIFGNTDQKIKEIDLSVGSHHLGNHANFQTTAGLHRTISRYLEDNDADICFGGYMVCSPLNSTDKNRSIGNSGVRWQTLNLGTTIWSRETIDILSPLKGLIYAIEPEAEDKCTIIIEHKASASTSFYTRFEKVRIANALEVGSTVGAGQHIAHSGSTKEKIDTIRVQIILDLLGCERNFPSSAFPEEEALWRSICPSPSVFISRAKKDRPASKTISDILNIRKESLGKSLSISYDKPLHMVRGQGQFLLDTTGRKYLDTVNNVAHVGHEHPRVVRAGQNQSGLLNTNTRYLHDNIIEFAHDLLETFPPELSVVHFVNSGSEANELAMRMVKANTGQKDMMAIEVGYHGNTGGCIDISSYKFDGKGGSGAPEHTHILPIPDPYRGIHRGEDTGELYAEYAHQKIKAVKDKGRNIGGFIVESILSCGGQIMLPEGYLSRIYDTVRAEGGLCIADEVQVGFGRCGQHFWAFELQDVIPDIVTVGKPIGNGHPLAAVITTQEVAEKFANGMEYFNTFGGNPVSCAIGREVLSVIKEEKLQQNALEIGQYLTEKLMALQAKHSIIGDVRGIGFFLGFELVRNRETLEPADAEASYLANRMRDRGILMSTDGPLHNVLKIKPPMCFNRADADFLIENLDIVLSENFMKQGN